MNMLIGLIICILFDYVKEVYYHLRLWTMNILPLSRSGNIIGLMISQIRIKPYSYFPCFTDKYHLFANVEISDILVQKFKTLQCSLC
jgi:hypothetical protein